MLDKKTRKILEKRNMEAKSTIEERKELEKELRPQIEAVTDTAVLKASGKGLTSSDLIKSTQENILQNEQLGLFDSIPLQPKDVFPTLLARLPIFLPVKRSRQKDLIDEDNYFHFNTPFGKGYRSGPYLTIRDEDTMLALDRLRCKQLHGPGNNLPIRVSEDLFAKDESGKVRVDIVICTITQINKELGLSDSGKNYKETLNSVRRLGNTKIELTTNKKDRYLGLYKEGGGFQLLDVRWKAYEDQGIVFVQFSPIVTQWLHKEFTFINWQVRKALGRNDKAKALHRFLSSQPKDYCRDLLETANLIGIQGEKRRIRTSIDKAASALKEVGWLEDYAIIGSGRSIPYKLHTIR